MISLVTLRRGANGKKNLQFLIVQFTIADQADFFKCNFLPKTRCLILNDLSFLNLKQNKNAVG